MTALENYVKKMQETLPELCDVRELIRMGFFSSDQQAYALRKSKLGPEYIKMHGRYKYLKESVIEYLTLGSAE